MPVKEQMKLENRISTYRTVSESLNIISDKDLQELLKSAKPIGSGIGGPVSNLTVDDTQVFVKRLRLSKFELLPENIKSTKNYFDLPLYYQYGVGSAGFGAWRELAAQQISTEWVLSKKTVNFPILYHSRVLSCFNQEPLSMAHCKTLD